MAPNDVGAFSQHQVVHSFQKIDGLIALETSKVEFDGDIKEGDHVELFSLPDGRTILSKAEVSPSYPQIERITKAYVYFNTEINVIEV